MDRPTLKNSKAGRKSSSSIGKSSKVTPVPTPPTFSHPFDSSSNMVGMSEKISNVIHHA